MNNIQLNLKLFKYVAVPHMRFYIESKVRPRQAQHTHIRDRLGANYPFMVIVIYLHLSTAFNLNLII